MICRSGWLAAAWSMTRWQSSGQSCIRPSMAFPLWFLPLRPNLAGRRGGATGECVRLRGGEATRAAPVWMRRRPARSDRKLSESKRVLVILNDPLDLAIANDRGAPARRVGRYDDLVSALGEERRRVSIAARCIDI